jgi:DNA-binding response OmpR family regulator
MLPKLDGFKVCRMLKADDKYKHIPVILLSARTQDFDLETGKQQGADAYITKPFQPENLLGKIKELLNAPARS